MNKRDEWRIKQVEDALDGLPQIVDNPETGDIEMEFGLEDLFRSPAVPDSVRNKSLATRSF